MSITIPSCNAHAYMKFSKKNFAPYAKNATVKNIITVNKYNVGMKSLDRAIIVSDTLKTRNVSNFYLLGSGYGSVSVSGSAAGSGFRLFHTPRDWPRFFFCFSFQSLPKKEQDQYPAFMNEKMTKLGLKRNIVWLINQTQRG